MSMTASEQGATVGILAGMGVHSTAPFLKTVLQECRTQYGAKYEPDYPRMVVYQWPIPLYPDRPVDHDRLRITIELGLQGLLRNDVAFVAMPCNTAHLYYDALAAACTVPLINMVESAVAALPANSQNVAILATRPTRDSGLYQRAISNVGLPAIATDGTQELIDGLLLRIERGGTADELHPAWRSVLDAAAADGADTVLVGCTDLNAAMGPEAPGAPRVIDGTRVLASRVVEVWRSLSGAEVH